MRNKKRNGALYIAAGLTIFLFPQILRIAIAIFLITMGIIKLLE